jgi:glycosyltransferase involved in cell wall biosynthesis
MLSVVIPARNEEAVLPRALTALTKGAAPGELEVIVACNGCSDRTREIAEAWGSPVRAVESAVASKAAALRAGDREARSFPRVYLDADVVLSLESLRALGRALEAAPPRVASPRLVVDVERSRWLVRAYYAIWTRLPYHRDGLIGSGVYAVSAEGRRRFDTFPDVISDDGWVRLQFTPEERLSVADAEFRIVAPRTLGALLRVKLRSQKGAIQLLKRFPDLARNEQRNYRGALGQILTQPRLWPAALVYAGVLGLTKLWGHWLNRRGDLAAWERDETSRCLADTRKS